MPSAECGSVWPGAKRAVPGRGASRVSAAWLFPGTASYSAYVIAVGPSRCVQVALKAVGMPPLASSTVKPSSRSRATYQAQERYSRQAGSAKFQMVRVQSDRRSRCASTQAWAAVVASCMTEGY
jgi:hypothetical protein